MTDLEINVSIAEKCGWKWWKCDQLSSLVFKQNKPSTHASVYLWEETARPSDLTKVNVYSPKYSSDLNAMHEAEKTLYPVTGREWMKYEEWLRHMTVQDAIHSHYTFHATSHQRAEAFLRVFNLWKD